MNATQKKELKRIYGELETLQEAAQALATELRDAFDEKSEKWRESDKGQEADREADAAQSLVDDIERAKDAVSDHVSE